MSDFFVRLVVTVGWTGYFPRISGTVASLLCCLLFFFVQSLGFHLIFWIVITALGYIMSERAVKVLECKDPRSFVIDEWAGMGLGLLFIPHSIFNYVVGFVLFRFFDVYKPLGIRRIDRGNHPTNIMSDDILAGIYTNLLLQIFIRIT